MPSAAQPPKASRHSALCSLLTEDSRLMTPGSRKNSAMP